MAQVEVRVNYCDPCGGKTKATATRRFEWFGQRYSVDVCDKHDAGLQAALDKWIAVASCTTISYSPPAPVAPPAGLYEKPRVLPGPQDRWMISSHAEQRMVERQVDRDIAKRVAEWPESTAASRKDETLREHYGQGLVVVVDPTRDMIVTVAGRQKTAVG